MNRAGIWVSILFCPLLCASCFNIKSDSTVEKDAGEFLKNKYGRDFTFVSVYNTTIGHGKGAIMATGNEFDVNFQTADSLPMAFVVHCSYDDSGNFSARDNYKESLFLLQAGKDLEKKFHEAIPANPGHIFFSLACDSLMEDIQPGQIDYRKITAQHPG